MDSVSLRAVVAAAAAGSVPTAAHAARFGNPDEPPQGEINTKNHPASVTDPGPQNPAISSQVPCAFSPPATDVGDMPMFWASFNNAPRRIQDGGWTRQVTQADFQIAEQISGVNMRHWKHQSRRRQLAPRVSVGDNSSGRKTRSIRNLACAPWHSSPASRSPAVHHCILSR